MICNIKSVFIDLHKAFWRDEGGIIYVLEGWGHNCLPILYCWMGWRRDHLSLRWWKGAAASPPATSWMEQTWDHVGLRKIRGRVSLSSFTCLSHQTEVIATLFHVLLGMLQNKRIRECSQEKRVRGQNG